MLRAHYLVCATQRSGSTLLCELLKGTGVAGLPGGVLRGACAAPACRRTPAIIWTACRAPAPGIRDDATAARGARVLSLVGLADYREHLERTFAWGTTDNGVFGAKLMWNQLADCRRWPASCPSTAGLDRSSC